MLNAYYDSIDNYLEVCYSWREYRPDWDGPFEEWHEDRRRIGENGHEVRALDPLTHALVFNSISIGIGEITADNAGEVYARSKIVEAFHGDFVQYADPDKRFILEPEHIQQHIGLRTNVSFEPREEWAQRFFIGHGDELSKDGRTSPEMGSDEDDANYWDRRPDVSKTTEFRRQYSTALRKQEKKAAEA